MLSRTQLISQFTDFYVGHGIKHISSIYSHQYVWNVRNQITDSAESSLCWRARPKLVFRLTSAFPETSSFHWCGADWWDQRNRRLLMSLSHTFHVVYLYASSTAGCPTMILVLDIIYIYSWPIAFIWHFRSNADWACKVQISTLTG